MTDGDKEKGHQGLATLLCNLQGEEEEQVDSHLNKNTGKLKEILIDHKKTQKII
jgi:hypothetical protein